MHKLSRFPNGVLTLLQQATALGSPEAWSNIMALSCKPEQNSLRWWEFYGYAEALPYDRGFRGVTVGFAGFTTRDGTGPGDAIALFEEYYRRGGKDLRPLADKPDRLINVIGSLANDPRWQQAQWHRFIATYVTDTSRLLRERGFDKPRALTLGAVLDCAFNQGSDGEAGMRWVAERVPKVIHDERAFLAGFLKERTRVAGTHAFNSPPINGVHRVQQYQDLLTANALDLTHCDTLIRRVTRWQLQ